MSREKTSSEGWGSGAAKSLMVFNWTVAVFPGEWKCAKVTLVFALRHRRHIAGRKQKIAH